ncbi:Hypothetical predicted protein [Cloeon dipterum]|uniref:protein-serine/threonine phosphatase n=1 Tax=Cloeon dipterum TaxID=197152 RepID=A0A8S1D313_9INSE|nr:Hypothetical predicted protein [Cloeon dipterum]
MLLRSLKSMENCPMDLTPKRKETLLKLPMLVLKLLRLVLKDPPVLVVPPARPEDLQVLEARGVAEASKLEEVAPHHRDQEEAKEKQQSRKKGLLKLPQTSKTKLNILLASSFNLFFISRDSSDEDSEDETFDTEDESEDDDSSEGGSGSEGGEEEEDEDELEKDDDDEGMIKSRDLLMKLLKRKRKAVETYDEEEEDESGPKKKIFCGLSSTPAMESGTTAVVALLGKEKVTVANIGDSRAILGRLVKTENGHEMKVIELSNDHKPELPEEKERIENAGGVVDDDGRVDGGLNLSRAFGDFVFKSKKDMPAEKQEVIAFPDVISVDLKFEQDEADQFLFVACDGIWNDMSSDNVADFIWTRLEKDVPMKDILEQMFKHILAPNMSGDGTGCDNMTAVIVRFDGPEKAEQSENNSSSTKEEADMK